MRKFIILSIVSIFAFMAVGCGKSVEITEYPAFYTPKIKHVAVLPFVNEAYHYAAGQKIAGAFAQNLRANGTYEVLDMSQDPQQKGQPHTEEFKRLMSRLCAQGVQAVFVGTVENYSFNESVDYDPVPVGPYDGPYGPAYGGYGYGYYNPCLVNQQITFTARVTVIVSMLDTSTGATLWATTTPVKGMSYDVSGGFFADSETSKNSLFSRATQQVVEQLTKQFCVTNEKIKLHDKTLEVGSLNENGVFKKSSHIKADQTAYLVLSLPDSCALNTFKISVSQTDPSEQKILSENITWKRGLTKKLFKLGNLRPGKYKASLNHRNKNIFTHKFQSKSE